MTAKFYARTTAAAMKGLKVRLVREVQTSVFTYPAGMLFVITGKMNGLEMEGEVCSHCGVRARLRKIPPSYVDVI